MRPKSLRAPALWFRLAPIIVLFSLVGCGKTAAPVVADQNRARALLDSTLSSWQKGETVESLKKANPAVHVEEEKWKRGDKLTKFQIEGEGKESGAERAFTVNLWLTDAKGAESQQQVVYKVGTAPILTVFRAMF